MSQQKQFISLTIFVAIILTAFAVAYYFLYSLPKYNNDKLNLQKQKQEEEIRYEREVAAIEAEAREVDSNIKMAKLAKKIQDDCIENTQNSVVSYFDKSNTTFDPLFFPYEDENSFNRNARLLTSLSAYQSCLYNDPRYSSDNLALKSIITEASSAERSINNFLFNYKEKNPDLCDSYMLTDSSKKTCDFLEKQGYDFG